MLGKFVKELKTSLRQKSTYVYFIGIVALILIANTAVVAFRLFYGANEGTYAYNLLEYATWCFVIPYYTCVFIASIGFGREYGHVNFSAKDSSFPMRRKCSQVYLSKLLVSFVLGVIFLVVAAVALMLITSLFQLGDGGLKWYSVKDFLKKTAIALPLWYAGVSFGMMFLFMFDKRRMAFISYFIMTFAIPRIIMIFAAEPFKIAAFRVVRTYTITQNISLIPYSADPSRNVPLTIAIGLIYGTIATVIGIIVYVKKELKRAA